MNEIIDILKYTIPSVVTGTVAAYFLKQFVLEEQSKRKFELFKEKKKESLPLRLQAYERMTLFLERIELVNILTRNEAFDYNKIEYSKQLIQQINTEFEHNLVQQIYMSSECWTLIETAKQTTLNVITAQSMREEIKSTEDLIKALAEEAKHKDTPLQLAKEFMIKEIHQLF